MASRYGEGDLDDELESHLEIETQENIERGMTPEEARCAARRKFGSLALAKELCREARGLASFDRWRQDLRFAVRIFRRTPAFTAAAILSVAVGIGATTALFSLVDAILLHPLPYAVPDRLVTLALANPKLNLGFDELPISAPFLRAWRGHTGAFEQIAEYQPSPLTLTGSSQPERIAAARASVGLFTVLGVKAILGRTYTAQEDQPGRDNVVVISHALWTRRFGSDQGIIGRRVLLDGRSFTIIGVMPPRFHFPSTGEIPAMYKALSRSDIWKPLALTPAEAADIGNLSYFAVARLKACVGVAQARAELNAAVDRMVRESKEFFPGWSASVRTLADKVSGDVRPAVMLLFGAAGLLLTITCANVANLLLARAARRRGEIGMRLALGAGRLRLLRQLLSESLLLGISGGAAGIAIASGLLRLFPAVAPAGLLPRMDEIGLDGRVLGFSLALSLLTALVFGSAPAVESLRIPIGAALRTGGRTAAAATGGRMRQALMVAEFAITLVLLTGTVLLARSFALLMRVPAGFRTENVLTMHVPMSAMKHWHWRARSLYVRDIVEKCERLPGVQAAGIIDQLPLTGENNISNLTVEGRPVTDMSKAATADFRGVTPGYFLAMGIPLKRGRMFTNRDNADSPGVALISETAARRLWPGIADPIGNRFKRGDDPNEPWVQVVGIVEDVRSSGLDMQPRPQIYRPYEQNSLLEVTLAIRSASDPAGLAGAVRGEIRKIDQDQPVERVMLLKQVVADSVSGRRLQVLILGLFAGLALLLAGVGIYGVVSYSVAQRTHEIGLRMALGASRARILAGVMKQAGLVACAGGAIGLAGAFATTRVLRGFLYGVTATDPAAFTAAVALLLIVALAATWMPARRAARVDPMVALRYE